MAEKVRADDRLTPITYIQVTADMTAEETFNREISPLKNIKDNYEKIILTLDKNTLGNYDGIKVLNLLDWLLEEKQTKGVEHPVRATLAIPLPAASAL